MKFIVKQINNICVIVSKLEAKIKKKKKPEEVNFVTCIYW